jgi:site-specific DNA recombinase
VSRTVKLDGYIRVSRVGGRGGESFISPDVQRERIEAYAKAQGHELATVHVELDESGGKLERPKLQEALARIERGESGGIIVAKLDRFARSVAGAAQALERVEAAGGVLVAVDLGMDTSTSAGRLMRNVLMSLAEFELDRFRESWSTAQAHAVARGVHVASRTPTGYRRRADARLEPDPAAVGVIRELFQRRAGGEGWTALARFLDESGVRGPYSNATWTPSAVGKMIANPVYLGEARSGEHVNADAHEALVTRVEWEAAQMNGRASASPRNGDGLLLSGLVRCAGCRYLMKPDTMRGRDGSRLGLYRCRGRHAAGKCPAPASVMARVLDPHVEQTFLAALGPTGPLAEATTSTDAVEIASQHVDDAERELDEYLGANLVSVVGPERFRAGLELRQEALDTARAELTEARQASVFADTLALTPGGLVEAWPTLSVSEQRHLLTAAVDAVMVRAVRGSGRAVPIEERVLVLWRGQSPDDLPRRGRRVPLSSFSWPE